MKTRNFYIDGVKYPMVKTDVVVIGSGCAGFNAADWLYDLGERDFILMTEGIQKGTSRNTGSDKQTYYKLSLSADEQDSVGEMAHTLAAGGGMNKDTALVEAACSLKSFFKLVNLGVPFPTNEYGEYVGYKTDHDPRKRATSAGPLTSKYMTECLEKSVARKGIDILDHLTAIKLVVRRGRIVGIIAFDTSKTSMQNKGLTYIACNYVILATGGPAITYLNSIYPESQTGMTGMALEAGAKGANLQEWQYGLGSTKFRWNVSGTYQQVLPRYIAIDEYGNEREFLNDYFDDPFKAVDMVFLKGYQWPFDTKKLHGSSVIDIIVQHEIFHNNCRIYMDFTRNPSCIDDKGFAHLDKETYHYLEKSGALCKRPIDRLAIMNTPAIELYAQHDIDLYTQPLEVAVCAQHCNGGIDVDANWETCVEGLYVAGEAAGTFGAYRPGGSALNSTQVGSMRAAEHIFYADPVTKPVLDWQTAMNDAETEMNAVICQIRSLPVKKNSEQLEKLLMYAQRRMSEVAGHMRNKLAFAELEEDITNAIKRAFETTITCNGDLPKLYKYRDMLITQLAMVNAMDVGTHEFGMRGSAMVLGKNGETLSDKLADYSYESPRNETSDKIIVTTYDRVSASSKLVDVRPLPENDDWFEVVWNRYMERTGSKN